MKTSRSPLWQIPGSSMFFGLLIIFASGTLGQESSPNPSKEPAISVSTALGDLISPMPSTVPTPSAELPVTKVPTKDTGSDVSSKAPPVSKLLVATVSNKETTSIRTLSLEQHSTTHHLEGEPITERKEMATLKQTKPTDSTTDNRTSAYAEATTTVAATTKAVGKSPTTVGELTSSNITGTSGRSTYLLPRGRKGDKEKSTTPGQRVHVPTTRDPNIKRPETLFTTGTSTVRTPEADTGVTDSPSKGPRRVTVTPTVGGRVSDPVATKSPSKATGGVVAAIILSVLLLLIILVALVCCWRRHRSGSTSFKTAAWAGQAAMLDDSALDKELEQGAVTAGDGDARRATLTTFFGKRQSRVPSVAMEEVVEKGAGDVEEAQRLMGEDASRVSCLEGPGEANGKLPESSVQCAQETEFPPPPADQEQTPPTQLE
ncbi:leukosialin-like isoform X2 [Sphaerodactylus townsendi]|uniref:Uncharacterized protein n=2 Tax=Sphaerodactylus townsendi TaxID=933632 RepID=A0ACB8EWV9_9SAUR|nr:leukosialin-like isoform X2 [Sphaerodactylus townsendi]